ncbi:MAG: hypothetical protein EOR85_28020 [Mesorhizobium sp.]|nr:MAG: hypothetical protein EOR79_28545 [Mesorhizobium sp.]RWM76433.1 MAG: hypothetical protein EOR81_23370 [Mesorhizobium sp.]RWM92595.1 MAG: hypothetical protein EOR85_28020 [Mesorhizobium sp.]RWN62689.1 MAG: hypothetical protein EOS00_08440 [Mesorhizobium sp.]RWN94669.1 MAG: hypothetical protein EOS06_29860 [Mesorhizobium sp.]
MITNDVCCVAIYYDRKRTAFPVISTIGTDLAQHMIDDVGYHYASEAKQSAAHALLKDESSRRIYAVVSTRTTRQNSSASR